MRFIAPARAAVPPECFDQPVFAALIGYHDLLVSSDWPDLATLNARLQPLTHTLTDGPLALVAQNASSDDESHYELRIFQRGEIPTRPGNWHDLLNALIWKHFPAIKSALNARQAADIVRVGCRQRTREQDAMTQFDEAGAVVVLRDLALLRLWDAHDWYGLFWQQRDAWHDGRISLSVFGHALFEHALDGQMLLLAKTLVFFADATAADDSEIDRRTAAAISQQICLNDPQELRPLPLSGIPGWHRDHQDAAFYHSKPCFRPLRAGRSYPAPIHWCH